MERFVNKKNVKLFLLTKPKREAAQADGSLPHPRLINKPELKPSL